MVDWFTRIFTLIVNRNKFLGKIKYYAILRFFVKLSANFIIPVYFSVRQKNGQYSLLMDSNREKKIIVSLTSFPTRINKVWLVIESILRQHQKPDVIILWLSKEQFPSLNTLPANLLKMRERGLQIELKDNDLRSHKKYYYCLQKFPNDIMITIDDDIFYPTDMIEELMKWYYKFPNSIIARYGNKIKVVNKSISPYHEWELNFKQTVPDFKVFFGSGGGTLFPPGCLPSETLNKELFMNLCLYADDIWLNTMCRLNNIKIFRTRTSQCSLLPIVNKKNISLYTQNLGENLNNTQLENIRDYFISNKGIDPYFEIFHS